MLMAGLHQNGNSIGNTNIITMPMIICSGSPTFMKSMNVYCPAGMTRAFGGVENGDAKHMLAPTVTANRNGTGLTPT